MANSRPYSGEHLSSFLVDNSVRPEESTTARMEGMLGWGAPPYMESLDSFLYVFVPGRIFPITESETDGIRFRMALFAVLISNLS